VAAVKIFYTVSWSDLRSWMGEFPTMIVASSAWDGKRLRRTSTVTDGRELVCDSGGFLAARRWGEFPYSEAEYVEWAMTHNPDWLATMDYCAEPELGRESVEWCIRHTMDRARYLMATYPDLPWLPVIQGDEVADYLTCINQYKQFDLVRDYMGVGSLCRRTRLAEIEEIVSTLGWALPDTKFHLFGVKLSAARSPILHKYAASLDTSAWQWADQGTGLKWISRRSCKALGINPISQRRYKFEVCRPEYANKLKEEMSKARQQPALL